MMLIILLRLVLLKARVWSRLLLLGRARLVNLVSWLRRLRFLVVKLKRLRVCRVFGTTVI